MPTRCNRCLYCRSFCLLNMFRASICTSSGAQEYYTVVAACGIDSTKYHRQDFSECNIDIPIFDCYRNIANRQLHPLYPLKKGRYYCKNGVGNMVTVLNHCYTDSLFYLCHTATDRPPAALEADHRSVSVQIYLYIIKFFYFPNDAQ